MNKNKKGFTLVELLVVVLIIGILAAVALPQYNKAVKKARYANLKPLVESIYQARQVHYLETGDYGSFTGDLNVSLNGTTNPQSKVWSFSGGGGCVMEADYTYCRHNEVAYYKHNDGTRACVRYTHAKELKDLCELETGKVSDDKELQFYWY